MEKWDHEDTNTPSLQHSSSPFASVARGVLDYVLRDMAHPEGGFYSAEDADSEGHEGKFYCWTRKELMDVLGPDDGAWACEYFGVSEKGNFVDHSHPNPLPGQNVLSVVKPDAKLSANDSLIFCVPSRPCLNFHSEGREVSARRKPMVR